MKSDLPPLLLAVLIACGSGYFLLRERPLETNTFNSTTYTSSEREGKPFYWYYFENEEFWGAILVEERYHYVGQEKTRNKSIVRFKDMNKEGFLEVSVNEGEMLLVSKDGSTQDVSGSFSFSETPMHINNGSFDTQKNPKLEIFNHLLQSEINQHEPVD